MEQRYQAVLAVIRDGVPIVKVAHRFDVSRQAIHRWLRWYEADGLHGLVDRSHSPPRCSHQMDPAVEVWVGHEPSIGARDGGLQAMTGSPIGRDGRFAPVREGSNKLLPGAVAQWVRAADS